jgi:hypothetical protein
VTSWPRSVSNWTIFLRTRRRQQIETHPASKLQFAWDSQFFSSFGYTEPRASRRQHEVSPHARPATVKPVTRSPYVVSALYNRGRSLLTNRGRRFAYKVNTRRSSRRLCCSDARGNGSYGCHRGGAAGGADEGGRVRAGAGAGVPHPGAVLHRVLPDQEPQPPPPGAVPQRAPHGRAARRPAARRRVLAHRSSRRDAELVARARTPEG